MNLYLDDDCVKGSLLGVLRSAGHRIMLPADVQLSGASDPRHLTHAMQTGFVVLTRNHDDFDDLHELVKTTGGAHSGILVIRSDNDPTRDMKDRDIVRSLANLEGAGVPIANEFHILNHWR